MSKQYVLRSGALHMYRKDGSLVVVPKLTLVTHVGPVEDPTQIEPLAGLVGGRLCYRAFERRKGQNLHEMQYGGEVVYMYASVQKVYPNKDVPEFWVDNFWNVMLQAV